MTPPTVLDSQDRLVDAETAVASQTDRLQVLSATLDLLTPRLEPRIPEFPIRPLTVDQYEYLVELGFYGDVQTEMLNGFVVDRMTHGTLACMVLSRLMRLFARVIATSIGPHSGPYNAASGLRTT